ncbi:MAG: hypothetical protein A2504_12910 [Bdellovibrionales bacterium RIFOXYD12_FULL_39_22]|nr:MAG: hypothetical protein A2560_04755 [Bdellovibrionales bacterium RIFOXYD1_FULL_39_84]OFZ96094.1 MAG: hypothetical protein A2504_12910 [Bdellovibrionales bacterium RIFOXYD12_FULL_39_22]
MNISDIKNCSFKFFKKISKRDVLETTITVLVKNIENQVQEIEKLKKEIQELRNIINRLKDEKGKSDIKKQIIIQNQIMAMIKNDEEKPKGGKVKEVKSALHYSGHSGLTKQMASLLNSMTPLKTI